MRFTPNEEFFGAQASVARPYASPLSESPLYPAGIRKTPGFIFMRRGSPTGWVSFDKAGTEMA